MRTVRTLLVASVLALSFAPNSHAQPGAKTPTPLSALTFLLGKWVATGGGTPGQASGQTTFALNLQDHVIVRTNEAEYPATKDRPASRHDDLMVIYAVENGDLRADYYDSEGHTIRYALSFPAGGQVVFTSDDVTGQPRYRLTYMTAESDQLDGSFEVAPPGQDAFKTYLTWQSRRAQ